MNDCLKRFFTVICICIQIFNWNREPVSAQPSLDSLQFFLDHLQKNTNDSVFRKEVEKVQKIYTYDTLNDDTLITNLLHIESLLSDKIEEDLLMNFKPFNRQILFSFTKKIIILSQLSPNGNKNLLYATALNNAGVLYNLFGEWQKGNHLIEKAFVIREKNLSGRNCDYAESLINMAGVYWCNGNKKMALDFAQKSLTITDREEAKFQACRAKCLFFLGVSYREMHNYQLAEQYFEKELEIRKKLLGEENVRYGLRVYYTAEMLMYLWQFEKAFFLYTKAIEITKKTIGDETLQYAYCIEGLGSAYYRLAEYKKAVPYYLKSIAIKEKLFGAQYSDIALSVHNLGTAYQKMGAFADALPLFQRACEISKNAFLQGNELDFNYAFSMNQLASLYQATGQFSEALSLLYDVLVITKKSLEEESPYYTRALNNLALLHENIGKYDSALHYYKKIVKVRYKTIGENDPEYATSLDNLARLYNKIGKNNIALHLCLHALQIRKQKLGENSPYYAASLNSLGELYIQKHRFDSAAILLQQALKIRKQVFGNEHPDYIKSINSLAFLNLEIGNNNGSVRLFAEADNAQLKLIQRTCTSLSEQEKMNLLKENYNQFSFLPSLLYCKKISAPAVIKQTSNNQIILKGMILENQQKILDEIRKSNDSITIKMYRQWQSERSYLGKQLLLPVKERTSDFDSVKKQTNYLEELMARRSDVFYNYLQRKIITVNDIGRQLEKGQAAVEFIHFKYYNKRWTDSTIYAAIILLPGDTAVKFVPLFEERQLKFLLSRSGRGDFWAVNKLYGYDTENKNISGACSSLYNLIWKPLEKYLGDVNTIYYSPASLLHRIAFNAIGYDAAHLLINKYRLTQVFSMRSLAFSGADISKPFSVNIWGNIDYNQKNTNKSQVFGQSNLSSPASYNYYADERKLRSETWQHLQGTEQEIYSLKKLFTDNAINTIIVSDTNATEERFKDLDGKSPQVLHIATHGFFLGKEKLRNNLNNKAAGNAFKSQSNSMLRSGLVLSGGDNTWKNNTVQPGKEDGILTAYEIAQMDLSNTRLAVLSACNTALGDLHCNEGVIGLQRAFKMAGVKQLVLSLWKIPDIQTAELMTLFYKNLLSSQSTSAALRNAQLALKEKYPSPYYWAGFVLAE